MEDRPKKRWGCAAKVLVGLLGLAVLVGGGGYYLFQRTAKVGARGFCGRLTADVELMALAPAEKADATALLSALEDAFLEGDLTFDAAIALLQHIERTSLREIILLTQIRARIEACEALSVAEREDASRQVRRATLGISRRAFRPDAVEVLLDQVTRRNDDGHRRLAQDLSVETLRSFARSAGAMSDDVGLPSDAQRVDMVDLLRRLVETVLPSVDVPAPSYALLRLEVVEPGRKVVAQDGVPTETIYTDAHAREGLVFLYDDSRVVRYGWAGAWIDDLDEFRRVIRQALSRDPGLRLSVDAGPGVIYDDVVRLLDVAIEVGIEDIKFVGQEAE